MSAPRPPIVALVGPTGSGKTPLALALAELLPLEVISCDSQAVYRGMEIGTAKPTAAERAQVPHHLLDVAAPSDEFSAARFAALAEDSIAGIAGRGKLPLLVGGTGLYLRALVDGMFEGPSKDEQVRATLTRRAEEAGPEALHGELASIDPEAAARIPPRDVMRVVRALEVYALTGKSITAHHRASRERPKRYQALYLGLTPPRAELYARVDARARAMFDAGLVEEALCLAKEPSSRGRLGSIMGYREALALDAGRIDREEAIRRTAQDQRHYAKRQLTWFRALAGVEWLQWPPSPPLVAERIQRFLEEARGVS